MKIGIELINNLQALLDVEAPINLCCEYELSWAGIPFADVFPHNAKKELGQI